MTPDKAIDEIRDIAETVFRPNAEAADRESPTANGVLAANIRLLADRGYFGLAIDTHYGGMGAGDFTRREFTEVIAAACGVTAFTQQQFHAGGGFVGGAVNEEMRADLLPKFASGELICGVAFSHLRRPGPPIVTATAVDGGYLIDGRAPWVTGWSFIDAFILGATIVPDSPNTGGRGAESSPSRFGSGGEERAGVGSEADKEAQVRSPQNWGLGGQPGSEVQHLFAYVPRAGNDHSMTPDPPVELHVMNASDTVEVDLSSLFVPQSHVINVAPAEKLKRNDYCGISGHVFLPLGCARGSVRYLRDLAAQRGNTKLTDIADNFERDIDNCRREAIQWNGSCADMPEYKEHALGARTRSIELAVRAAHAAVAATGGTAQLLDRVPQRLMREAVFYTTLAQTPDVQAGTLDRLTP